jgi:hypothetical protein
MIKIPYSLLEENDCINYMDNSEMQLKNRIKELEIQLDKYVGMCANCPNLGNGYFALKDLEAQLAAMRDFVEGVLRDCEAWDTGNFDAEDIISTLLDITPQVLAPDAGAVLLERLRKAEAERVEAVPKDVEPLAKAVHEAYCSQYEVLNKRPYWTHGDYNKLDEATKWFDRKTVRAVLAYLRDHGMIREAE